MFAACTLATLDTHANTEICICIYTYNTDYQIKGICNIDRYHKKIKTNMIRCIIDMDSESNIDKHVVFASRTVAPSTEQHRKPIRATERLTTSNIRRTKTSKRTPHLRFFGNPLL